MTNTEKLNYDKVRYKSVAYMRLKEGMVIVTGKVNRYGKFVENPGAEKLISSLQEYEQGCDITISYRDILVSEFLCVQTEEATIKLGNRDMESLQNLWELALNIEENYDMQKVTLDTYGDVTGLRSFIQKMKFCLNNYELTGDDNDLKGAINNLERARFYGEAYSKRIAV